MMRPIVLTIATLSLATCSTGRPPDAAGPTSREAPGANREDLEAVVMRDTQAIQGAIVQYFVHHSDYPARLEDLVAADDLTRTDDILDRLPRDPWGEAYVYRLVPDACIVLSKGPDRREGTGDDIVNRWAEYTARGE